MHKIGVHFHSDSFAISQWLPSQHTFSLSQFQPVAAANVQETLHQAEGREKMQVFVPIRVQDPVNTTDDESDTDDSDNNTE